MDLSNGGYYPKLQACIPFTPVTGARLLVANCDGSHGEAGAALAKEYTEEALDLEALRALHLEAFWPPFGWSFGPQDG